MPEYPIIVLGTPRSGTSFVAKVLQERMGVEMYLDDIDTPDNWECKEAMRLNDLYCTKKISKPSYKKKMLEYFEKRKAKSKYWGWKDPRQFAMLPWVLKHFGENCSIVRTFRKPSLVLKSMVTKFAWTQAEAEYFFMFQNMRMDVALGKRKIIIVKYPEDGSRISEDDMKQSLRKSFFELQFNPGSLLRAS